jgi:hypothetical protein
MRYIGIDPDTEKNGLHNMPFWDLIQFLEERPDAHVIIEAGWLNKSVNHHFAENKYVAASIGSKVGANAEIGKLIEKFCQNNARPYRLVKPVKSKVNQQQFKVYTGWTKRTNQEQRDAGMLVIGNFKP